MPVQAPAKSLRCIIDIKEELSLLVRRLSGFFSLRRSTNAADTAGAAYTTKISAMLASTAKENVIFEKFVGNIEDIDSVINSDEILSQYKFLLQRGFA